MMKFEPCPWQGKILTLPASRPVNANVDPQYTDGNERLRWSRVS
jgi:hypothetical protein